MEVKQSAIFKTAAHIRFHPCIKSFTSVFAITSSWNYSAMSARLPIALLDQVFLRPVDADTESLLLISEDGFVSRVRFHVLRCWGSA